VATKVMNRLLVSKQVKCKLETERFNLKEQYKVEVKQHQFRISNKFAALEIVKSVFLNLFEL
jgi:hypothetical protein